jgi:hypothetical protein
VPLDRESTQIGTWQEWVYRPRETLVKSIADATLQHIQENKKWNRGYIESLIRPRITTLVLSLVAHFGTKNMAVKDEERCRLAMPNFCRLVFDNKRDGFIQAYCHIISVYVCSLLTNVEPHEGYAIAVSNNPPPPAWLPQSLQSWVNDAKNVTQTTLRLMPLITLAPSGINVSTTKATSLSDLLVTVLEKPDPGCQLQKSLEEHCSRQCMVEEEVEQNREREKREKKQNKEKEKEERQKQDSSISGVSDDSGQQGSAGNDQCSDQSEKEVGAGGNVNSESPADSAMVGRTKHKVTPGTSSTTDVLKNQHELNNRPNTKSKMALHPENREALQDEFARKNAMIPVALVRMMNNNVQRMAQRRFKDVQDKRSFYSDVQGVDSRRQINEEMIGEIFTLLTKYAERHARELPAETGAAWSHIGGNNNLEERAEKVVSTPSSNQTLGRVILSSRGEQRAGEAGRVTADEGKTLLAVTSATANEKEKVTGRPPESSTTTPMMKKGKKRTNTTGGSTGGSRRGSTGGSTGSNGKKRNKRGSKLGEWAHTHGIQQKMLLFTDESQQDENKQETDILKQMEGSIASDKRALGEHDSNLSQA